MLIHWDGYGARYLFLPELCIAYALVWVCMKGRNNRQSDGACAALLHAHKGAA